MEFCEYNIESYDNMDKFIIGGKSTFTLRNEITKNRFTYRFTKSKKDDNVFWVYMLCSNLNDEKSDYKFIGVYSQEKGFTNSTKSKIQGTQGVRVISWFINNLKARTIPENVRMYHMGYCARCGRPLTTPESITSGFGPICMQKEIIEGNTQPVKLLEQHEEKVEQLKLEL